MYKVLGFVLLGAVPVTAQTVSQNLDTATKKLLASPAMYSGSLSFYVADDAGNTVYEYQGNKGLSTASTQKIFTAAAALEALGKNYTYTTTAGYRGTVSGGTLAGDLIISSNGDPTLGSWRYTSYKPDNFKQKLVAAVRDLGITTISGNIIVDDSYFDLQTVPGGWPWDDLGNYYGAGVWGVNWRENQFDMNMTGSKISGFNVPMEDINWVSEVKTGGTSDESLVFTAPYSSTALINGTLPAKGITVSGAMPNPPLTLGKEMKSWLQEAGIKINGTVETAALQRFSGKEQNMVPDKTFFTWQSPPLEKMVYWFLNKSINLYGETFVKTMAKEKKGQRSFSAGVQYLKDFWVSKGINAAMINFADGSGLSPQNYVSAKAEVQAMLYAKKQPWFDAFFEGFPAQSNGLKMKSGTIRNTKSYVGAHTSASGKKYVFSIIVNNYQGSGVSDALFAVLNNLK